MTRRARWSLERLHKSRTEMRCAHCGRTIAEGERFYLEDPGARGACRAECAKALMAPRTATGQRELDWHDR